MKHSSGWGNRACALPKSGKSCQNSRRVTFQRNYRPPGVTNSTVSRILTIKPAIALLLLGVGALLGACATTVRTELVQHHRSAECVVLLHGLNRSWRAMGKLADSLQERAFLLGIGLLVSVGGLCPDPRAETDKAYR